MQTKIFGVKEAGKNEVFTVLATKLCAGNTCERKLMNLAGSRDCVRLAILPAGFTSDDPLKWKTMGFTCATLMFEAHNAIATNFDEMESGSDLEVEL